MAGNALHARTSMGDVSVLQNRLILNAIIYNDLGCHLTHFRPYCSIKWYKAYLLC